MSSRALIVLVCLAATLFTSGNAVAVEPVFYEGFDAGKLEGVVGKAGPALAMDGRGVIDLNRGTLAFFYQSKDAPKESEWGGMGGVSSGYDQGYWRMVMRFNLRRQCFGFDLFDVGFYSPPLVLPTPFGRWQAGQWHHLAAVWDRNEGVTVYEDGKRAGSNWGKHHWEWSQIPQQLSLTGPLDEVYVYGECLSDAQIAQLAKGQKPDGAPLALEQRRELELARMGWQDQSLANLPVVAPDAPLTLTFARVNHCVDALRPVAYPYEGLLRTTWPSIKYGASIRGQRLDISLDANQSYDRVRIFSHRDFKGRFLRIQPGLETPLLDVDIPHATFWHAKLPQLCSDTALVLTREFGQLGQIDFYRAEPLTKKHQPAKAQSFVLAKAEAFPVSEQGKTIQGQISRDGWNPVNGVTQATPAWQLKTAAFGGFQAFTAEPTDSQAFDGVEVTLVAEGLSKPTPVRLEVSEPVYPERVWLAADVVLQPKGPGKQSYRLLLRGKPVINLPPLQTQKYLKDGRYADEVIPVPAVGFTVTLTAGEPAAWIMGDGGTTLRLCLTDKAKAVTIAADDQVEWMREAYAEAMEGHGYSWSRLQATLLWLALNAPQRMEFRQMWERVDASKPHIMGLEIAPLVYTPPVNDSGAPDWAYWQMQAMKRLIRHVHWTIDNKQPWTGEFGGIWNDDSTHIENWMGYALSMDGSGKIHGALDRYWEGLWNLHLVEGLGKNTQDNGHYSEEGTSNLGMRLMVQYGDPIAYAHTIAAMSHVQYWLEKNPEGPGYVWKSGWVGPWGAWTEGAFHIGKRAGGHLTDPIVSLGYLVWYNRHPKAVDYLVGLDEKGTGFLGTAREIASDWPAALKRYQETLAKPVGRGGPQQEGHFNAIHELGVSDEVRKLHAVEYQPLQPLAHYWGSKQTDIHWWNWKISGDERFLVDSCQRVLQWFEAHDWLNGEAMPSMDRNPLPRALLVRSRMGALAANRGSSGIMWPQFAISYPKGADEIAALVTENLPNRCSVRLYPFTDKPHPLQVRLWRCNGEFTVTLAADKDNDGKADETIWSKPLRLDRGTDIDLLLPPRQTAILSVVPIKIEAENFDRPDPAISLRSVELVYGDHLVVNVYNNGSKPVDDVLVRVRDARSGEIVINGEQHTGPIEAPLDLRPRFKMVEFKNINANTWGELIIEVDPEGKVDDLNRHNNLVRMKYRSNYQREGGWR